MAGENILSYTDLKAKQYSRVIQKLPWYWLQHEVTLHGDIVHVHCQKVTFIQSSSYLFERTNLERLFLKSGIFNSASHNFILQGARFLSSASNRNDSRIVTKAT